MSGGANGPLVRTVATPFLDVAYEESGPASGLTVILLHGFPDDVRTWDGVVPGLVDDGLRVLVPWLRGYGATRLPASDTPRSGEQAALGDDLLQFMDALRVDRAVLAGYDWGGRAACVASALAPDRVRGLVTIGGYNIQSIAAAGRPASPEQEMRLWYQWYFQGPRGRAGLDVNRRDLCKLLWRLWSPNWNFDDATFEATAKSWDNPDFVDIVIHSYRHRHQAAPGDPRLAGIEARLAARPVVAVPSIILHGATDGVDPPKASEKHVAMFSRLAARHVVPGAGHFLPREAPGAVVDAIRQLLAQDA